MGLDQQGGPRWANQTQGSLTARHSRPHRFGATKGWASRSSGLPRPSIYALPKTSDLACVGQVEAALERVSEARATRVVFDLERVRSIDFAGLGTIMRANERARSGTFEVVVVRPRGLANRVFTLTRAGKQLALVDRVSQTLTHARRKDGPRDRRPQAHA